LLEGLSKYSQWFAKNGSAKQPDNKNYVQYDISQRYDPDVAVSHYQGGDE